MKTYDTPDNDSRYQNEQSQYGFNKEMGADNHALATLHYTDSDLNTFDSSLTTDAGTYCDGTAYTVNTGIRYEPSQAGLETIYWKPNLKVRSTYRGVHVIRTQVIRTSRVIRTGFWGKT